MASELHVAKSNGVVVQDADADITVTVDFDNDRVIIESDDMEGRALCMGQEDAESLTRVLNAVCNQIDVYHGVQRFQPGNCRVRKRPLVVDAFQLTEATRKDNSNWPKWLHEAWQRDVVDVGAGGAVCPQPIGSSTGPLSIVTLEGTVTCNIGDWIIRGIKGELYPCRNDIFLATYEIAD